MGKKFLQLNDISAYKSAFVLSNDVWRIVLGWDYFAKDTVGKQFVRAVDSISANVAEGFGRYSKKDKIRFYRISFGSVKESLDWNQKALTRKLVSRKEHQEIFSRLNDLPREVHQLIRFTTERLTQ